MVGMIRLVLSDYLGVVLRGPSHYLIERKEKVIPSF
jgi:hypothetical protein